MLSIETGHEEVTGHCTCRGGETRVFRRFVHDADGARAVDLVACTEGHPGAGAGMAVSPGGWGEGADPGLRVCMVPEWRVTDTRGPGCMLRDAPGSRRAGEPVPGRMLARSGALESGHGRSAPAIADAVWQRDRRLARAPGAA